LFQEASLDRDRHLADPRQAAVPVDALLADSHLDDLCRAARTQRPGVAPTTGAPSAKGSGDTVAVVAADADGWAVSLIQSVFHTFGSGILEPTTGILCHNRGSLFSLDSASPNVLEGGKRPAHTLMPVIVTREGAVEAVVGAMGGRAQPQIIAQVLLRLLGMGLTPAASLEGPRWVVGGLELGTSLATVFAERSAHRAIGPALAAAGWPVVSLNDLDEEVGHAQLVRSRAGSLESASDPRADGAAAAE
jgi:gamma-glutamyltranspeptidase/glutathione hydrolase